jgi:hypothetical protein
MLRQRELKGWNRLVAAVRRILDGEKDVDYLVKTEHLDAEDIVIVDDITRKATEV